MDQLGSPPPIPIHIVSLPVSMALDFGSEVEYPRMDREKLLSRQRAGRRDIPREPLYFAILPGLISRERRFNLLCRGFGVTSSIRHGLRVFRPILAAIIEAASWARSGPCSITDSAKIAMT